MTNTTKTTTTATVHHDTETQKKAFEALKKGATEKRTKEAFNKVQNKATAWFYATALATLKRDKTTFTKDKAHIVLTIGKEIIRLQPSKTKVLVRVNKAFKEAHSNYTYEEHSSWAQPFAVEITVDEIVKCYNSANE